MAVGRISGPLLAQNLFRDGIPLAFYNTSSSEPPVLYLDVATGRVGIQKDSPAYNLDVAGTVNADALRVAYTGNGTGQATIGRLFLSSGTINSTVGDITIKPLGGDNIILDSTVTATGVTRISAGINSVSSQTGSLIVEGGIGVSGTSTIFGVLTVDGGQQSYGIGEGQFIVSGGASVSKDLWVGGVLHAVLSTATVATLSTYADGVLINDENNGVYWPMLAGSRTGYVNPQANSKFFVSLSSGTFTSPILIASSATVANGVSRGALDVAGGATIDGDTYLGGSTKTSSTTTNTGALVVTGGVGISENLNVGGELNVTGNIYAVGNITAEGNIQLGNNTSTDTLFVEAEIATDLIPKEDNTYNIGSEIARWEKAFFDKLYASTIESQTGPVTINPASGLLDINADIRVNGTKPLGTAPVVTNILYVTEDGNDTNDGRAEDPTRACRTISGAVRSPYYTPGTSIRVAPGKYLEQNPILLLPYTSVLGSDLRTTVIQPINKTQDLFHVQSGCYLFGMQFLNGRSGVLPGPYANGYNRGAYCIAFPPQVGGNKIDTFHSPYVQNCTNQTGPWMYDGIMFQPNQTVQVPLAAGTGTWQANTTTIVVSLSTGTILENMSVNNGQQNPGFFNARTLLLANKPFVQEQVVAYVNQTFPGFEYQREKCFRDVGIILENISYDSAFGGNEKSVEAGLAYYEGVVSLIAGQETQTVAAINYINTLSQLIITNSVAPDLLASTGTYAQVINTALVGGNISSQSISDNLNIITSIINSGTIIAPEIYKGAGPDAGAVSAEILLQANRTFIQNEVVAWIADTYPTFVYNTATCYRDVGLIVDAVSQDILLGGNSKSIEAGVSYWTGGYNQILGQESTTTAAISHASAVSLKIIDNQSYTPTIGNTSTQVINTFFSNGFLASDAVSRNFNIINDIIIGGPTMAPVNYRGGGLFASTGVQIEETKYAPTVTSVTPLGGNNYQIVLDKPTIGFGTNATLYFGNTTVFPVPDDEIPEEWAQRRIDTKGGMGGMLVDGSVVSDRSPVGSMVLNAFTQVSQGGRGIHIINNGYAQLVSIFTIFCNIAVEVDSGGIASITNSNSNFGDICLIAKGYGTREFSATVYNPPYPTFIESGEFYPNGYFPQNGQVLLFVPDTANRPHIALVMEIEPPPGYTNSQSLPGFLTAQINVATLTTGTITISGIDTTDIAVGQTIYARDQFGRFTDDLGNLYLAADTTITDIGYQTITLSKAISQGGGDTTNPNYFTLYTCGNAYYTVLSSTIYDNPITVGDSVIPVEQQGPETTALAFIDSLVQQIIDNQTITGVLNTTTSQTLIPSITGGSGAGTFISDKIATIIDIVANGTGVAPTITKTGIPPSGAGSAVTLISANIEFIAQEVAESVVLVTYNKEKCIRDVRLILQQLIYDLQAGGNYYSVYSGLSYWSRAGTYHLVQLGENLRDPSLMPDGATINFYQRSYMSASGYTFEYVGAGMNYGALPQVGRADPVQTKEVLQVDGGKVFFTSTDQNGDFRIGPGLVISQATGVLSGRTFTKSLFANMTPFILAVEGG
jgi:hypothetical protein